MRKTAFITGATSGIGEACALKFAEGGYDVVITGRNAERLSELQSQIKAGGTDAEVLCFDVRDKQQAHDAVEQLFAHSSGRWKDIDVLINNAGLALGLDKLQEGSEDDWETMIDTNIKGLLTMTRLIVPRMVERGKGHVINIGSVAGDAAYACGNVYCATKAAVKAITDGLRLDLVDTPVRVTNVKPGLVETNFSRTRFHGDAARAEKVYQGIKPLTGADIADVCYYAANAPAHVQIAEVLVLATHQANGSTIYRS